MKRAKKSPLKNRLFSYLFLGICILSFIVILSTFFLSSQQDNRTKALDNSSPLSSIRALLEKNGNARVIIQYQDTLVQRGDGETETSPIAAMTTTDRKREKMSVLSALQGSTYAITQDYTFVPLLALQVDAGAFNRLENLLQNRKIKAIFPDSQMTPDLYDTRQLVGVPPVENGIPSLTRKGVFLKGNGQGSIVAVVGGGISQSHAFLTKKTSLGYCVGSCPNGTSEQVGVPAGVNCPGNDTVCSHETEIGGIIAGNLMTLPIQPGNPVRHQIAGIAPGATLASIRVVTKTCSSPTTCSYGITTSSAIRGMEWLLGIPEKGKIAAVNFSYSDGGKTAFCDTTSAYTSVISLLKAAGIAFVKSAGNSGLSGTITDPGCVSNAIPVGATTKVNVLANFSNVATFHPNFIVAPGVEIWTSLPTVGKWTQVYGTSFAAPHVAALFATIKQLYPEHSVDQVIAMLRQSGTSIPETRPGKPQKNYSLARLDRAVVDFDLQKGNVCWGRVLQSGDTFYWRNGCRGYVGESDVCLQAVLPLNQYEKEKYQQWVAQGKPPVPGCL